MSTNLHGSKCTLNRLENIEEESPASWLQATCPPPETPTESMEFLARSWSLPAVELSKALSQTYISGGNHVDKSTLCSADADQAHLGTFVVSKEAEPKQLPKAESPPNSPRGSDDTKELFLLHHVLNQDFLSNQQLLKNGPYRSMMRGKAMNRRLKDQKERKKQELRTHNAQLHAAVSVAGVATAVAALAASSATSPEKSTSQNKTPSKTSAAIASAAALVASHCIEMAEDLGADHDQILSVVSSAINARTNGDIMTLTAGAATALRGAATLRTRLQKGYGAATIALTEQQTEEGKESNVSVALNFVSCGAELLKRTRKGIPSNSVREIANDCSFNINGDAGDLHWKQVSFNLNSNMQVVAKMKSKHMAGTFTKKKKCVVTGVYCDIPAWPERETDDSNAKKAYFGIQTTDRVIEFECGSKCDKLMWAEGIQHMLHYRANMR